MQGEKRGRNMKKILILAIVIAMISSFVMPAIAGNTDTIEVTLTPNAEADITVDQSQFNVTGLGSHNTTATDWATLTNSGDVSVSVDVSAENTTNWELDTVGHNSFNLTITGDGGAIAGALKWDIAETFDADILHGATVTFGLESYMPTSSSTNTEQTLTITFSATAL